MNVMWKMLVTVTGLGAFIVVAFMSFTTALAQSQTSPPCCLDRWDPAWTDRGMWGPGMMGPGQRQRMTRHWTFMHAGIPSEYRGVRSPLAPTSDDLQAGGALYQKQCAVCHGTEGMGDGEAAKALNPSPALLAYMIQMPMSVDEYLMWTVSEGGKAFETAMPGFKSTLSAEEIWKIVAYMRAGFPAIAQQ
jgi:mono/diheme cytochrome c family protein